MILSQMRACELFAELDDRELLELSRHVTERVVPAGERILQEGSEAVSLFAIEKGSVGVFRESGTPEHHEESKLTELPAGSTFGEMSLEEGRNHGHPKRSAGVVAQEEVTLIELGYEAMDRIALEDPKLGMKLYRALARSMSQKTRRTTDDLVSLISLSRLAALGEMTAAISHEVVNPLAQVVLASDLVGHLLAQPNPDLDTIASRVSELRSGVERTLKIIEGLKNLARSGEGDPSLPTLIEPLVHDTYNLCSERFSAAGISFTLEPIKPSLEASCRKVQISQVLVNLLNNAADAVSSLPTDARWVRVSCARAGDWIEISVTDSGSGIPDPIRERIFAPFYTTKSRGRGSGLGLSISRRLMESQGGSLTLDASCSNTRFVARLPAVRS